MLLLTYKDTVLATDKSVRKYTGFSSKNVLYSLFKFIDRKVTVKYWKDFSRTVGLKKERKRGPKPKHCKFDEYLMTLIHIKLGFDQHCLADLFGLSKSYVSRILISWMNVLYGVFKFWVKWPSAAAVRSKLPEDYPEKYTNTRIIFDCQSYKP